MSAIDSVKIITGKGIIQPSSINYDLFFQILDSITVKTRSWRNMSEAFIISKFGSNNAPVFIYLTSEFKDNIEVIFSFPQGQQKLYKINDGPWQIYTSKLKITENGVLYAKSILLDGSDSEISELTIFLEYADRPYIKTELSADKMRYTITIDYKWYTTKLYRTGADIFFKPYTGPFTIDRNTTIYAQGSSVDEESEVATRFCYEIYVPQPLISYALSVDRTNANININYGTCLHKFYKTEEDISWIPYTGSFNLNRNTIIYAKGITNGNVESYVSTLNLDSIIL